MNLEQLAKYLEVTPEEAQKAVDELKRVPKDELERAKLEERAVLARELPIGVEGYKNFYWCAWRREAPPYADEWVEAFASGEWTILEGHRGSTKTFTMPITYQAYCLGKEPWTSSLAIQAADPSAKDTAKQVADIIQYFEGWKECFPSIVPDESAGWGDEGFNIKDTSVEYSAWLEKCSRDHGKDPSFVGLGLESRRIRGMHPKRLFLDDLHDKMNSAFPKQRAAVVATVRSNILPTLNKPSGAGESFVGVTCTPWSYDDAYHMLFETGLFNKITTPLFTYDEEGDYDLDGETIKITCPEWFPIEKIRAIKKAYKGSKIEFAREYLCDLEAARDAAYKWYTYPSDEIDEDWPLINGVDYAAIELPTQAQEGTRSYFAMCDLYLVPTGAVIGDGILERCSQAQAEIYVTSSPHLHKGHIKTVIESVGEGRAFYQMMQRVQGSHVETMAYKDVAKGPKEKRQWEILSPLFERAVLRVSDAETPYLNALRSYLDNYPNIERRGAPEWDVADALLEAVMGSPELNSYMVAIQPRVPQKANPFLKLASWSRR